MSNRGKSNWSVKKLFLLVSLSQTETNKKSVKNITTLVSYNHFNLLQLKMLTYQSYLRPPPIVSDIPVIN